MSADLCRYWICPETQQAGPLALLAPYTKTSCVAQAPGLLERQDCTWAKAPSTIVPPDKFEDKIIKNSKATAKLSPKHRATSDHRALCNRTRHMPMKPALMLNEQMSKVQPIYSKDNTKKGENCIKERKKKGALCLQGGSLIGRLLEKAALERVWRPEAGIQLKGLILEQMSHISWLRLDTERMNIEAKHSELWDLIMNTG